jgi:hypothetical protein
MAMDRRAKKLEKKRKQRTEAKKQARVTALRSVLMDRALVRAVGDSAPFGPCWISNEWDDLSQPALVNVVVTRQLPDGRFAVGTALVDRTAFGAKDGFVRGPLTRRELNDFILEIGEPHGGMHACELLVAQSVVFHAVDYGRKFGFEPHPDFPANLFGPRPETLLATPWHAAEKPIYVMSPGENVESFRRKLSAARGYDVEVSTSEEEWEVEAEAPLQG